jgi:hypothetical protein
LEIVQPDKHTNVAVQPGVATDRFAREIVPFLTHSDAARLRRLNAKPLGGFASTSATRALLKSALMLQYPHRQHS